MRPVLAVVVLAMLASVLAACGGAEPAEDADAPRDVASPSEAAVSTIAYGDHPDQVADLSLPEGAGQHPVVVLVHGGFWREQYRRDLMTPLARDLVGRGYAVWNIEYRRVGGAGGWPETFEDAAAAIDHLATLDARLDLHRVATVGHSAGGHLAMWLASRHRLADGAPGADPQVRPIFAVSQAGVVDLDLAARNGLGGGAAPALMGGGPGEVPDRYAAGDPAALVPIDIPSLLVHGRDDTTVPLRQSEAYVDAADEAGDPARLAVVDGDHFTVITPDTEVWRTVLDALAEALGPR